MSLFLFWKQRGLILQQQRIINLLDEGLNRKLDTILRRSGGVPGAANTGTAGAAPVAAARVEGALEMA
jgi:hypothetical protein